MSDWAEYKGEYEKMEYDVVLKNGKVHGPCWPNNSKFTVLTGPDAGKDIPDIFVAKFRPTENPTEQ